MIKIARESNAKEFIIATEIGIMEKLKKENPEKKFYHISPDIICEDMKKITLEKILLALEHPEKYRITVPENIAKRAKRSIENMMN